MTFDLITIPALSFPSTLGLCSEIVRLCALSLHKEITAQWLKLGKMPFINRLLLARELRRLPKAQQGQGQSAAIVFRDNLRHRFSIQRA